MFQVGDFVVNASNGVCRIEDVVTMEMPGGRGAKECFLVVPLGGNAAKMYVPVENKKNQIRSIMSKKQAGDLLDDITSIHEAWIESDKLREKTYKEAIYSCDPRQLVSILHTMYNRGQARQAEGKKITTIDERYFRIAEKNLLEELAFVLDLEPEQVRTMILKQIRKARKR